MRAFHRKYPFIFKKKKMGRKPNKDIEINEKIKYFTRLQNEIKKMKKNLISIRKQ